MQNIYFTQAVKLLEKIDQTQTQAMETAAKQLAKTVQDDGIIYTLGSGHSLSVALEGFHRSGSMACISAIMDPSFNFYPSAHAATDIERLENFVPIIMKKHDFTDKDTIIITSNSGRNPAGIDAALYAKKHGVKVIIITALQAHQKTQSRHSSGKMLRDCGDIVIDNCVSKEETALELKGKPVGPVSTIAGAAIMNNILYLATQMLINKGFDVPLYLSSNNVGDDNNAKQAARYKGRIKQLM